MYFTPSFRSHSRSRMQARRRELERHSWLGNRKLDSVAELLARSRTHPHPQSNTSPPELDVAGRGADAEGPIAIGIRVAKAIRREDEEDEGVAVHPSEDASR